MIIQKILNTSISLMKIPLTNIVILLQKSKYDKRLSQNHKLNQYTKQDM